MDTIVECITLGADDFLMKPVNRILLKAKLNNALEKKHFHDKELKYQEKIKQAQYEKIRKQLLDGMKNNLEPLIERKLLVDALRDMVPSENLKKIAQIARDMDKALTAGQMKKVTTLFAREWQARKALASTISTQRMDKLISGAMQQGAQAAKVCGAGGGGCIAFIVPSEKKNSVASALTRLKGQVIRFRFVRRGLRVQKI